MSRALKIIRADTLNGAAVKVLVEHADRQLHPFAIINAGQNLLKASSIEPSCQQEAALVVGPDHFELAPVFGHEDHTVFAVADIDADATLSQERQPGKTATHIARSENKV